MPAISFDDLDTNIQPVPGWRFYASLPDLPGLATNGSVLSFLVQKFVGQHRGINYEQVPHQAGVRNYPTGFHTDNIQIQVVESQQFAFTQYIRAWSQLIIKDDGSFGMPAQYKRSITVDALDEGGNVLETFGWDFCSPTVQDAFDWDGTGSHYLLTGCGFVTDGPRGTSSTDNGVVTAGAGTGGSGSGTSGGGDAAPAAPAASDLDTSGSSVGYQ